MEAAPGLPREVSALAGIGGRLYRAGGTLAAVVREIAKQRVHVVVRGPIDEMSTCSLLGHQARVRKLLQMEGKRGGRDAQGFLNDARCQPALPGHDQRPKNFEAQWVSQCRQRLNDFFLFHDSRIVELKMFVKLGLRQSK